MFRGIEFCLPAGEALVVTGANGAGKSTLLRILAGLEVASAGEVVHHAHLGYVSPELSLYSQLTGIEHLEFARNLRGLPANSDETLLESVGLSDAQNVRVSAYSTGMKARLRLALAIQCEPGILLLDEPGASLDEEGRSLVERVLDEQRSRGVVVLATNDPAERRFGDCELKLGA